LGYVEINHAKYDVAWISYCFLARLTGEKGKPSYTEEELKETITIEWHAPKDAIELIERNKAESNGMVFKKESYLTALRECFK